MEGSEKMFRSNYRYLVSFAYSYQNNLGFGNAEINRKITI